MFRKFLAFIAFFFLFTSLAIAAGFNLSTHDLYQRGDDYYLKAKPAYVLIASEITIPLVLPSLYEDVLIVGDQLIYNPSATQIGAGWVESASTVHYYDFNNDSHTDVLIRSAATNKNSYLVSGSANKSSSPHLTQVIGSDTLGVDISSQSSFSINVNKSGITASRSGTVSQFSAVGGTSFTTFVALNENFDTPTATDTNLEVIEDSNYPGTTPYSLDAMAGNAVATFPMQIPLGINGLQPQLSVIYNSAGGNGLLGKKWQVSGISSISRCAKTVATDSTFSGVVYSENDAVCLDGKRLIPIGAGSSLANGQEYRTEIDEFSKVLLLKDAAKHKFIVYRKNGAIATYDVAQKTKGRSNSAEWRWYLSSVEDRFGNQSLFHYDELVTGEIIPIKVEYEGAEVEFIYNTNKRSDNVVTFSNGDQRESSKYLNKIITHTSDNGNLIPTHEYKYIYQNESGENTYSAYSGVLLLDSIQECAYEKTGSFSNKKCKEPVRLTWTDTTPAYVAGSDETSFSSIRKQTGVTDWNGDGLQDMYVVTDNQIDIHYGQSDGNLSSATALVTISSGHAKSVYAIDANQDGKSELIYRISGDYDVSDNQWYLLSNTGQATAIGTAFNYGNNSRFPLAIDSDRDGDLDIVLPTGSTSWTLYENNNGTFENGQNFLAAQSGVKGITLLGLVEDSYILLMEKEGEVNLAHMNGAGQLSAMVDSGLATDSYIPVDMNGDGLRDLVIPETGVLVSYLYDGNKFRRSASQVSDGVLFREYEGALTYREFPTRPADVNKDGKQDIVYVENGKIKYLESTGTNWILGGNITSFSGLNYGSPEGSAINYSSRVEIPQQCKVPLPPSGWGGPAEDTAEYKARQFFGSSFFRSFLLYPIMRTGIPNYVEHSWPNHLVEKPMYCIPGNGHTCPSGTTLTKTIGNSAPPTGYDIVATPGRPELPTAIRYSRGRQSYTDIDYSKNYTLMGKNYVADAQGNPIFVERRYPHDFPDAFGSNFTQTLYVLRAMSARINNTVFNLDSDMSFPYHLAEGAGNNTSWFTDSGYLRNGSDLRSNTVSMVNLTPQEIVYWQDHFNTLDPVALKGLLNDAVIAAMVIEKITSALKSCEDYVGEAVFTSEKSEKLDVLAYNARASELYYRSIYSDWQNDLTIDQDIGLVKFLALAIVSVTGIISDDFNASLFDPEFVRENIVIPSTSGSGAYDYQLLDVNGDGTLDVAKRFNSSGSLWVVERNTAPAHELVSSITDSLGIKTDIEYSTAANSDTHTKQGNSNALIQFASGSYPLVSKLIATDTLNNRVVKNTEYHYEGLRYDLTGRGLVGATKISANDSILNTLTESNYHQAFPFTGRLESVTNKVLSGSNELTVSSLSNAWLTTNTNANTLLNFVYLDNSTAREYELNGSNTPYSISEQSFNYDDYANVTSYTESVKATEAQVTPKRKYVRTAVFDIDGTNNNESDWLISFKTSQTEKWSGANNGQSSADRALSEKTLSHTYTAYRSGGVLTNALDTSARLSDSHGLPMSMQYFYNETGNITKIAEKKGSADYRTQYFSDFVNNKWPSIIRHSNFGGEHSAIKTTQDFDVRFGAVASTSGFSDLVTRATYDPFGEIATTLDRNAVTETITRAWCSTSAAECTLSNGHKAVYKVTVTKPGSPESSQYINPLNQVVKTETEGFEALSYNRTEIHYDALGRKEKESHPYAGVSPTNWTEYKNFDALNRPLKIEQADDGIIELTYSTQAGVRINTSTATHTDGSNSIINTRKEHLDAVGSITKVIQAEGTLDEVITLFDYDPQNNLDWSKVLTGNDTLAASAGIVVTSKYDVLGNRVRLNDPDAGLVSNQYDAFGRLTKSTDASNNVVDYGYDTLDRMVSRIEPEGTTNWHYDKSPECLLTDDAIPGAGLLNGQLCAVTELHNDLHLQYAYDANGNRTYEVKSILTHLVDGSGDRIRKHYTTENYFDELGRNQGMAYDSEVSIKKSYTTTGYLEKIFRETEEATPYWQATSYNTYGKIKEYQYGNGATTVNDYHSASGRLSGLNVTDTAGLGFGESYTWYSNSALSDRTWSHSVNGSTTETYSYDALNRLTSASGLSPVVKNYGYNKLGNMTSKDGVSGALVYSAINNAGPHAVTSANGISYGYDNRGNMTSRGADNVTYTSYNKPSTINGGSDNISFKYGPERGRYVQQNNNEIIYYSANGSYEESYNLADNSVEQRHYIGSSVVLKRTVNSASSTSETLEYLHRDYNSSVVGISDAAGNLIQQLSYSPFGGRISGDDSLSRKGYTDHEHLDSVNLIHMNGRVYDPVIGRFLSPDILVQAPYNSQSYNRYSYVWNNPVSFVDPTGYGVEEGYFNSGFIPEFTIGGDTSFGNGLINIPLNLSASLINVPLNLLGEVGAFTGQFEGEAITIGSSFHPVAGMGAMIGARVLGSMKFLKRTGVPDSKPISTYSGYPLDNDFIGPAVDFQAKLPRVRLSAGTQRLLGDAPEVMINPHNHHILEVNGRAGEHRALIREGQIILKSFNIDPLQGIENLIIAPNKGHTLTAATNLVDDLRSAKEFGFGRDEVIDILNDHGQRAVGR
jgi:RHS repeat-associated protein